MTNWIELGDWKAAQTEREGEDHDTDPAELAAFVSDGAMQRIAAHLASFRSRTRHTGRGGS
jgi:hypothetical protein